MRISSAVSQCSVGTRRIARNGPARLPRSKQARVAVHTGSYLGMRWGHQRIGQTEHCRQSSPIERRGKSAPALAAAGLDSTSVAIFTSCIVHEERRGRMSEGVPAARRALIAARQRRRGGAHVVPTEQGGSSADTQDAPVLLHSPSKGTELGVALDATPSYKVNGGFAFTVHRSARSAVIGAQIERARRRPFCDEQGPR